MKWNEINASIKNSLIQRGLKQPSRRLNELERIERNLEQFFPKYFANPELLKDVDKKAFKKNYAKTTGKNQLSGAEDSLINEIYVRLD